jgi:SAM-dependent methyltransferase
MKLMDVIQRQAIPEPWTEGEKIPWNDPDFSRRMLREHLSQEHDAASRRFEIIEKHVDWIHHQALSGGPARILDLGCGPGLYTSQLAKLGHECVGIDFSPASIAYASECARAEKLSCTYIQQDIRDADYGNGYDLVMLIFGEFNVFSPMDAKRILDKAHRALVKNGRLLLEPHTLAAVRKIGEQPPSWHSENSGLFSDRPHICLSESFWDDESQVATQRYFIIDALTGNVTRHAASTQAYANEQYQSLLEECGFGKVEFYASLNGSEDKAQSDLIAIVSQKATISNNCSNDKPSKAFIQDSNMIEA